MSLVELALNYFRPDCNVSRSSPSAILKEKQMNNSQAPCCAAAPSATAATPESTVCEIQCDCQAPCQCGEACTCASSE